MKKLIALALTAMLLLSAALLCGCKKDTAPSATEAPAATPSATEAPAATAESVTATEEPAASTETPAATGEPAKAETETAGTAAAEGETAKATPKGVVYIQLSSQYGFLPLAVPGEDDYVYPLKQYDAEGNMVENDIHISSEGFYVEYSTCDNQNCVDEGEVTFANRESRILGDCVMCLPNGVYLELLTMEEAVALINEIQAEESAAAEAESAAATAAPETAGTPAATEVPAATEAPAA